MRPGEGACARRPRAAAATGQPFPAPLRWHRTPQDHLIAVTEHVAEGVEDAGTLRLLGELGCDTTRGYLHSRALPPRVLTRWPAAAASAPARPRPWPPPPHDRCCATARTGVTAGADRARPRWSITTGDHRRLTRPSLTHTDHVAPTRTGWPSSPRGRGVRADRRTWRRAPPPPPGRAATSRWEAPQHSSDSVAHESERTVRAFRVAAVPVSRDPPGDAARPAAGRGSRRCPPVPQSNCSAISGRPGTAPEPAGPTVGPPNSGGQVQVRITGALRGLLQRPVGDQRGGRPVVDGQRQRDPRDLVPDRGQQPRRGQRLKLRKCPDAVRRGAPARPPMLSEQLTVLSRSSPGGAPMGVGDGLSGSLTALDWRAGSVRGRGRPGCGRLVWPGRGRGRRR